MTRIEFLPDNKNLFLNPRQNAVAKCGARYNESFRFVTLPFFPSFFFLSPRTKN